MALKDARAEFIRKTFNAAATGAVAELDALLEVAYSEGAERSQSAAKDTRCRYDGCKTPRTGDENSPWCDKHTVPNLLMSVPSGMFRVIRDICQERIRQDEKHSPNFPPDGTGKGMFEAGFECLPTGDEAKALYEAAKAAGRHTGAHVLVEEVCEALDEDDPVKLRAELIQVAAVAVKWVQAIDRRTTSRPCSYCSHPLSSHVMELTCYECVGDEGPMPSGACRMFQEER